MKTIVVMTTEANWKLAKEKGSHTQSTITTALEEVGFIHCTSPDQTTDTANRHFTDRDDVLFLLVDLGKVKPEVRFEPPPSGRPGLFPHVYGAINTDAVYKVIKPEKDESGQFKEPTELKELRE